MEYCCENLTGDEGTTSMASVQATYRVGPSSTELIDLTRPPEPGLVRRFGWAVALVAAGAGLLGFVIAGLSEPGYTATAYVELSPDTPAEAAAVRDLLRSQEVRSAVATELGSSLARLRPISVVDGPEPDTVGVRCPVATGTASRRLRSWPPAPPADLRIQQGSVTHDVVTGGVRRLGLEPARTAFVGAGTGLVGPCASSSSSPIWASSTYGRRPDVEDGRRL